METKVIIKEKAEAYDEVVNKLKGFMAQGVDPLITRANIQDFFPELKKSEDEQIREEIIDFLMLPHPQFVGKRDHKIWIAWLEKQGEQKIDNDDKTMLNACINTLRNVGHSHLATWLEKQKPMEDFNGEDYGIDSLWHAITILEKTLGEVEGYQTDDGILEHLCAIAAVRKLATERREQNSVKEEETTWKPSDEQMKALDIAIRAGIQLGSWEEKALRELQKQLKAL